MLIIGIAGGTGSGKTTVVHQIMNELPEAEVGIISQDSYYKENNNLSFAERALINFDHPRAIDFELLVAHLKELKAEKTTNDITTQFVTILGIFASIIVALFGGMSLVKAAVELLTNEGSLPLFVFVVSVLMLSFSGLIVLLTTWITSLNKEKSENSYLWTKVILFCFLIVCCVVSGLISYDLSKKPKVEKETHSADIKLELKANR